MAQRLRFPKMNLVIHTFNGGFMGLSASLLVLGLIGGLAFLVFISLAILDRVEEFKINR